MLARRASSVMKLSQKNTAARVRPVHVVLHVFLARTNELDRTAYSFRRLHRLQHIIRHDLAAEAPAQKRDVDLYVVGRAAGSMRDHLLARRDRLDRPPD